MEQLSFDRDVIEAVIESAHNIHDTIATLEVLLKNNPDALAELDYLRCELLDLTSAFE